MSEVLSEPGAARGARRFTFFPPDERQALRIRRFLMAAGTSLLVCLALFAFSSLGLLPLDASIQATAGIVALIALFYALFRTGLNLRFADPSLTTEQIGAALLFLTFVAYHLGPLREALDLFYGVALMFGVLRLSARRLLALAMVALAAHGSMLWMSYMRDPAMNLRVAVAHYVILLIVLPWFALMGGYVNRLRMRLSDSNRDLKRAFDRIEQVAIRDELTGMYNRRFLMESLEREKSRAERLGAAFSVCLVDIDHFKSINDTLGHAAGDAALKYFAAIVPQELRSVDVYGRFGGEEFLIILPGTACEGAESCAERVRARTAAGAFPGFPEGRHVTVTIGVATHAKGEEVTSLLARADSVLYQGKADGRNRVVAASGTGAAAIG